MGNFSFILFNQILVKNYTKFSFFLSFKYFFVFRIIEKNGGRAPLTYHQFQTVIAQLDPPQQAESPVSVRLIANAFTPISEDHDETYGVPTLEELGKSKIILQSRISC